MKILLEISTQFLNGPQKVLLLQGSAGSGKTFVCQQLTIEHQAIYIALNKDKSIVERTIQEHKVAVDQKFLLILDGYEELDTLQNIYHYFNLQQWPHAKVIVTCRPEYFANVRDHRVCFAPLLKNKFAFDLLMETTLPRANESSLATLMDKPPEVLDYCIAIAQEMQRQKTTKIIYKPTSRLFTDPQDPWPKYFGAKFTAVRMAAPLIKTGVHQYEFVNSSLIKYFADKKPASETKELNVGSVGAGLVPTQLLTGTHKGHPYANHYLNHRLITRDVNMLNLLADRVWQDEKFKELLFQLLLASRQDEKMQVAAANAITVLNRARVSFSGMDLSGIRIPFADISYGIFDNTQLPIADLRHIITSGVWLQGSNLSNSNLEGIKFGELAFIECSEKISAIAFNPNGDLLAVNVTLDKNTYVWKWKQHQLLYTLSGRISISATEANPLGDSIQFSSDGKLLAAGGQDRSISLWNITTGRPLHSDINGYGEIQFSPDNKILAASGRGIPCWNINTGKEICLYQESWQDSWSIRFSPDGKFLVELSKRDKKIRLWEMASRKLYRIDGKTNDENNFTNDMYQIQFSPRGDRIATLSFDGKVKLWDITRRELCHTLALTKARSCIRFNPSGTILATIDSSPNAIKIWDAGTGRQLIANLKSNFNILTMEFNHNETLLAAAGYGAIELWDIDTKQLFHKFQAHMEYIWHIQFTPDDKILASASDDKTIRFWDLTVIKNVNRSHEFTIINIQISNDGKIIVSGDAIGKVFLWDAKTGRCLHDFSGHNMVSDIVFSSDGKLLAIAESDNKNDIGRLRLWNLLTGVCIHVIKLSGRPAPTRSIHFSSDSKMIFTSSKTLQSWDTTTGQLLRAYKEYTEVILASCSYTFNNRDMYIAIAGKDHKICLWDISKQTPVYVFTGHQDSIVCVQFDRHGELLASASFDKSIRIWNIALKKIVCILHGHTKRVFKIRFSLDNQLIASAGIDNTVRLWEIKSGKMLHVFQGHADKVISLEFSPNGQLLASGSSDSTVRLWDMKTLCLTQILKHCTGQIISIKFINDDQLVISSTDTTLRFFQRIVTPQKVYWQLNWANQPAASLVVDGAQIEGVAGLTHSSYALLQQRGVTGKSSSLINDVPPNNLGTSLVKAAVQHHPIFVPPNDAKKNASANSNNQAEGLTTEQEIQAALALSRIG